MEARAKVLCVSVTHDYKKLQPEFAAPHLVQPPQQNLFGLTLLVGALVQLGSKLFNGLLRPRNLLLLHGTRRVSEAGQL